MNSTAAATPHMSAQMDQSRVLPAPRSFLLEDTPPLTHYTSTENTIGNISNIQRSTFVRSSNNVSVNNLHRTREATRSDGTTDPTGTQPVIEPPAEMETALETTLEPPSMDCSGIEDMPEEEIQADLIEHFGGQIPNQKNPNMEDSDSEIEDMPEEEYQNHLREVFGVAELPNASA